MHYNRKPLISDEHSPWEQMFINVAAENIGINRPSPIVNIADTTVLHSHEITFLTGTSYCRAHSVAKMLAAAVLNGGYPFAQSLQVAKCEQDTATSNKVLWIDTVHSFYSVCSIIDDLKQNFSISNDNLRFMCLDDLGTFNERYEAVLDNIISAIYDFKPALVIIDDMDHLAPDCGYNLTENFYLMIREVLDHLDTSLLCVGYNIMGKNKNTVGEIGKRLFAISTNIFRVINRGNANIIARVRGVSCDDQSEFTFNINDKNFPQEIIMTPDDSTCIDHVIEAAAVQEVFNTVINKEETVTPEQLITRLGKRHDSIKRVKRHQRLIVSAVTSGVLIRTDDGYYRLNTDDAAPDAKPIDYLDYYINKSLITNKIPNLPSQPLPKPLTFINTSPATLN